jgi:phosphinothricin acetyltransferase
MEPKANGRKNSQKFRIRPGTPGDLPGILSILNHYILNSHHTFDTVPFSVDDKRDWMAQFSQTGPYQLMVAESDNRIMGYAHSSAFKPKPAYDITVETTVYLQHDLTGSGLGTRLMNRLLERISDCDIRSAVAMITLPSPASVALHQKLGYREAGILSEAGFKFGRYWDVGLFQKFF